MLEVQATLLPLAAALVIGLVLGIERELAHKPAGLRTQLLITVGTAMFVVAGRTLGDDAGGRIAANVLTGLGFLGGGVILHHRGEVLGLTTAALVWVNGALGLAAGLGQYRLALAGAIVALLAMRVLGPFERRMSRRCRVVQYQVTARDEERVLALVRAALDGSHEPDGPLVVDRGDGTLKLRFGFCSAPDAHGDFLTRLSRLPDVVHVEVE